MAFKLDLFAEADAMRLLAREYYEIEHFDEAMDYESRFRKILDVLIHFGWDKEYMGI